MAANPNIPINGKTKDKKKKKILIPIFFSLIISQKNIIQRDSYFLNTLTNTSSFSHNEMRTTLPSTMNARKPQA